MLLNARSILLLTLFFLSGATGLVYELVWTRQLVFVFGGTTYAISTVLVAFMGGLGIGSFLAGRVSSGIQRPGLVYGVIEILIGVYALAVPLLLDQALPLYRAIYPSAETAPGILTAVRFAIGSLILLVPTTLMGATLPILVRYVTLQGGRLGATVGFIYGINTTGAMVGVLATGFVLIPVFGLLTTTRVAALVNIAIGLLAIIVFRQRSASLDQGGPAEGETRVPPTTAPLDAGTRSAILLVFAVSGFAAMVYQITWTRSLVMSLGSSTYSFTCILAAFIFGLALGSVAVARLVDRLRNPATAIGWVEVAIGLAAIVILPVYGQLPRLSYYLANEYGREHFGTLVLLRFGLIIAITLIPTVLMGTLFPLVTRSVTVGAGDEGAATGRAYLMNTVGTILGSFLAGFVMIEFVGLEAAVLIASLLNVLAGAALLYRAAQAGELGAWQPVSAVALVLLFGLGWLVFGRWDPLLVNSGSFMASMSPDEMRAHHRLLYYADGVDLSVLVGETTDPDLAPEQQDLMLTVNATVNASTGYDDLNTNILLAQLPILMANSAEQTCIIGLGCGMTLGSALQHPPEHIEQVDCVEISSQVIRAAELFKDYTYDATRDASQRARMIRGDGRNHMLLTDTRYDVIISEPSHPWMSGVANLFTHEMFSLCSERLNDDGLLLVWLHGYDMSVENFKLIVRTVQAVFPFVSIWELGQDDYGILVGKRPLQVDLDGLIARFNVQSVREDMYRVGLNRPARLVARFITAGEPLRAWAGSGLLHLDDNALVEFSSPRHVYDDQSDVLREQLFAMESSPFESIIRIDPTSLAHQEFVADVRRVRTARAARLDAQRALLSDSPDAVTHATAALRAGYARDPGNMELFMFARQKLRPVEAAETFAAELLQTRMPVIGDRRVANLPLILRQLLTQAQQANEAQRWAAAASYFEEALLILPTDANLVVVFANTLHKAGATQRAVVVLQRAVTDQVLTRNQIESAALLADIRDTPEYQAWTAEESGS